MMSEHGTGAIERYRVPRRIANLIREAIATGRLRMTMPLRCVSSFGGLSLSRHFRVDSHAAEQRLVATQNIEANRLAGGDFGAIENVGDVVEPNRLPRLEANQNIAGTQPLARGQIGRAHV